jgi:hypothetical protein
MLRGLLAAPLRMTALNAFAVSLPMLRLSIRDPVAAFAIELREQAASVQDCATFAVEALTILRSYDLHTMHAVLEAERGVGACLVDGSLNRTSRHHSDRAGWAGVLVAPCVEAAAAGPESIAQSTSASPKRRSKVPVMLPPQFAQARRSLLLWR